MNRRWRPLFITSDSVVPHWVCVVAVQLSTHIGLPPFVCSSAGEGQMLSLRYTVHPLALPHSLSLCLSLSLYRSLYLDGACLLCFITLSSIFQRHSHTFITKLHLIKDDLPHLFLAH